MSRKSKPTDDELATRLRARLRAGDPARGGEDLSPGEVWEMRRRMLAAVPERRRPRLLLGLASAAAAALALALGIALHREVPPPAPLPEAAAPAAPDAHLAAPAPPPVPTAAAPAPDQDAAERPARAAHRSHARRYPVRRVAATPVDRPEAPEPPPPPTPLQIQFDTPGGTRVVWVLKPAKP